MPTDKLLGGNRITDADPLQVQGMAATVPSDLATTTATIADGASLSNAVDLGLGRSLVVIVTPAGWTTAGFEFQGADALDGTYNDIYNTAGLKVATPAAIPASARVALDPADFKGTRYLKVRSATSGTPVNQSGGDVLTLVTAQL